MSTDVPGHGNFIDANSPPFDWRDPRNDDLWQGIDGINNPCPAGFRLPTMEEWEAEIDMYMDVYGSSWDVLFTSPLKLPAAGARYSSDPSHEGINGSYWSMSFYDDYSILLNFDDFDSRPRMLGHAFGFRNIGMSVRCIKD